MLVSDGTGCYLHWIASKLELFDYDNYHFPYGCYSFDCHFHNGGECDYVLMGGMI